MSFNTQSFTFTGTARQFEEAGVKLNGRFLDAVGVASLAKHGLLVEAGEGPKPARGRTPKMYTAVAREGMVFSSSNV